MTKETRLQIASAALSWVGTPFYPHIAEMGVGTDCVQLALAVYKQCGIVPIETQFPKYRLDAGEHLADSMVLKWLIGSKLMKKVDQMDAGTIVIVKAGRVEHHVGIAISKTQFVQSIRRYGVIVSEISDSTWKDRITSCWEPI